MRSFALAAVLFWLSSAHAQVEDAIELDVPDCAGVSGQDVFKLVALEVSPRPLQAPGSGQAAATRGGLECASEVARLWVEAPDRSPLRVEVALSELAPAARPRLLALAIAELIATSRLERVSRPTAASEPEPEPEPEPELAPYFQLWLGAGAAHGADPAVLAPAAAVGTVQGWQRLVIASDLRFEHGQRAVPDAVVRSDSLSLGLVAAWRLYSGSWQLLFGPGVRAGYAWLRASSSDENQRGLTLSGFWFGPCVQAAVELSLARHYGLHLGLEAGYVTQALRGLDSQDATLLELHGLWFALQAGVRWQPAP